jgi:hypothetical protein
MPHVQTRLREGLNGDDVYPDSAGNTPDIGACGSWDTSGGAAP